jgi:hypothetical protein
MLHVKSTFSLPLSAPTPEARATKAGCLVEPAEQVSRKLTDVYRACGASSRTLRVASTAAQDTAAQAAATVSVV